MSSLTMDDIVRLNNRGAELAQSGATDEEIGAVVSELVGQDEQRTFVRLCRNEAVIRRRRERIHGVRLFGGEGDE